MNIKRKSTYEIKPNKIKKFYFNYFTLFETKTNTNKTIHFYIHIKYQAGKIRYFRYIPQFFTS